MASLEGATYHCDVAGSSSTEGGRSTAIVLFTDLVGSTQLRSRLGEEAAEEVRRRHDRLVTDAIEANRGRLVKNLGDGVMAAFTGASDAVGTAVRIQQVVDRHNRSHPSPAVPDVRIGMSAGDVTFQEGDCFGTPVIEAARLCAAARGGQILVSEVVRLLAGSGGGVEFTQVGALELKGLPAPLPACAVGWRPLAVSSVPLPNLLTDIGRIFVGRETQVERLEQLWNEAAAGELRVAFLAGEPGVGKTRLAAELATAVYEQGGMVLAGRCDEDLGVPYQPFVEALRQFVDHTPMAEPSSHLGRFGGELVRLVPELADRARGLPPPLRSDPETERYRLFDAVAAWLAAVGAEEPLLLVLDDLQWAAKPTLLLLRHVARAPNSKRFLVLGTYRDTELGHDHPLVQILADLGRQPGVERFSLRGLDPAGVATFMERAAGHELEKEDLALARAIHEETEGNPFFVREVFRHLDETGAIQRREGGWTTRLPVEEIGIPEGVREVVVRRLSRLSEEANQALRVAAVVGTEFEFPVIQAVGGFEEEALLSALEEATDTRLVIEGSAAARYRFAHALVRDTLYNELSGTRRAAVHRRVGEAIETIHGGLDDHLPALAHHFARGSVTTAGTKKAVTYASRAGDRALAQLAYDEAVGYYHQGLDLLERAGPAVDDFRRQELLISLGDAQRRAGDPAHRQTLLAAAHLARGRGDSGALARSALANVRGYFQASAGSVDEERVAVLEAALEAVGVSEPATRARLLASLALEVVERGDRSRCARLSDEALELARRLDDPGALAAVLTARYFTISGPDTLTQRTADTVELLAAADRLGDPVTICLAFALRARLAVEGGDGAEAEACLAQAERLAVDLGQPQLRWFATLHRAGLELLSGRVDQAEGLNREQLRLGKAADAPEAVVVFAANQLLLGLERGDLANVEEAVHQATVRLPGLRLGAAMRPLLYCALDRHGEARELLTAAAEQASTWQPQNHMWVWALALYAAACARLGHTPAARALHDLLAPYPEQVVVGWGVALGSVSYSVGLLATTLGRFEEAEARFATAATTHARLGAPIWLARTRLEWARMLLARGQSGDAERARELLCQALATARELGLADVERRAADLLA
jgi:class 3 adenylate cyclase/tetratricopeptide (TPR) repeat protein